MDILGGESTILEDIIGFGTRSGQNIDQIWSGSKVITMLHPVILISAFNLTLSLGGISELMWIDVPKTNRHSLNIGVFEIVTLFLATLAKTF